MHNLIRMYNQNRIKMGYNNWNNYFNYCNSKS